MAAKPSTCKAPHTIRWGILATGWMAKVFTKDLLSDPSLRGVTDVRHEVVAVASSSSVDRARAFIRDHGVPATATAYGAYEDLVADPAVDIVYVATPHSHHFQNAMLALRAGKPVLVEKAFTANARQARCLVDAARERNLFLMEAMWTRFLPVSAEVRALVAAGTIGPVQRVLADASFGEAVEAKWGTQSRVTNLALAGGVLLDLGVYALTWVFQILYHLQPAPRRAPAVVSAMVKYPPTGVDEQTTVLMTFPAGPAITSTSTSTSGSGSGSGSDPDPAAALPTIGIATTGLRTATDPDLNGTTGAPVRIQGTCGEIQVFGPAFRPTHYRLIPKFDTTTGAPVGSLTAVKDVELPIPGPGLEVGGHGMFWEADEAARCLRDGKLQSDDMDWEESIAVMETMDQVRAQHGVVYPPEIETTDYPVKL